MDNKCFLDLEGCIWRCFRKQLYKKFHQSCWENIWYELLYSKNELGNRSFLETFSKYLGQLFHRAYVNSILNNLKLLQEQKINPTVLKVKEAQRITFMTLKLIFPFKNLILLKISFLRRSLSIPQKSLRNTLKCVHWWQIVFATWQTNERHLNLTFIWENCQRFSYLCRIWVQTLLNKVVL